MSDNRDGNGQDGRHETGGYQRVAQFEARERAWKATEALLHRLITRLSLAAQGGNPALDRHLESLRLALRSADPEALETQSEALFKILLDQEKEPRPSPRELVLRLLSQLRPPDDGMTADLQAVATLLHQATSNGELAHAVRESAAVINRLLRNGPVRERQAPPPPEKRPARTGLFAGLLGRGEGVAEGPDTTTLLLQMLEQIPFPPESTDDLEALKTRLENRPEPSEMPVVVRDIGALIDDMRQRERREREDLQTFLEVLTRRLQEIDAAVADVQIARSESAESSRNLDADVRDQVTGIATSVREAGGLDEVKRSIQSRLEIIQNHLTRFRELDIEYQDRLGRQVEQLTERLHHLESETDQLRQRVLEKQKLALQDTLTGIGNRLALEERFGQELARHRRFGLPLALLFMDVDHFKKINDTYGHKAGDRVLRTIAAQLADRMRETDFVARVGGEEFVVLMPGADTPAAARVADFLRAKVAECGFHFRNRRVQVTLSCGVAECREGDTLESLLERADQAMYRAKQSGRNRTVTSF